MCMDSLAFLRIAGPQTLDTLEFVDLLQARPASLYNNPWDRTVPHHLDPQELSTADHRWSFITYPP